jgi:hypothetical protein
MRTTNLVLVCAATLGTAAAAHADPKPESRALKVTSTAFADGTDIPTEYTCESSAEKAPPIAWSSTPKGTMSIALLVEDPDAPKGTVTHWMVSGLPANSVGIASGAALPHGAVALANQKGKRGYMGPCPPAGTGKHHYHFHVYALDDAPKAPADKAGFEAMIEGHTLADGELVGTFEHHEK